MSNAFEPLPDFIQLAQHAFASQGYAPSGPVLNATAKGLARLHVPATTAQRASHVSFDEMLKRCADA